MRLTTWMSTVCPKRGFGCDVQSAAKAFKFIAMARLRRVEVGLRRGRRSAHDASRLRSGLVRQHRRALRRPRSSRRLPICRLRLRMSIFPPHLRVAISQTFPRRRKADDRSTSTHSMIPELPTFPRRKLNRSLPASIRLQTWTCRHRWRHRAAPIFPRRCQPLREPRSTCRRPWAPHGRERSSRWARRSICRWRSPTQICPRRGRRLPCRHLSRSTRSCPYRAIKKICLSPATTSWTSTSMVRSGFMAADRSS